MKNCVVCYFRWYFGSWTDTFGKFQAKAFTQNVQGEGRSNNSWWWLGVTFIPNIIFLSRQTLTIICDNNKFSTIHKKISHVRYRSSIFIYHLDKCLDISSKYVAWNYLWVELFFVYRIYRSFHTSCNKLFCRGFNRVWFFSYSLTVWLSHSTLLNWLYACGALKNIISLGISRSKYK